jgi:pyruvate dehydrogenase E1 component alpha subunit
MDFLSCYEGFKQASQEVLKTSRPVLIEAVCERFRGHSISDPGLYRTKEDLQKTMQKDPIIHLKTLLMEEQWLNEESFKEIDKETREIAIASMKFAEGSPDPDPIILEEGIFAPRETP